MRVKLKKILCLNYSGTELEEEYWKDIDNLCNERILISSSDKDLPKHLRNTDCLFVKLGAKLDKKFINKMPNLKYVGVLGTGYGGIDVDTLTKKSIALCNISNYATSGVAEMTFGLILNHIRSIDKGLSQAKTGNYSEEGYIGSEINGKTFGIIGMGNIGTQTAKIAQAFGANVQYWSRNRKPKQEEQGILYKDLHDLLKTSDFISINLALNPETNEIFGGKELELIKKNAIIINLSPMELFNLKALSKKLSKNDMTFILDHADEMTDEDIARIKDFPNCIIQLPIGYTTNEAKTTKQASFVKSLVSFLEGKSFNQVN